MSVNLNDNDQARILGSTIAVSALADIAIVLRFISRKIKGNYAIDDLLAVIGLVSFRQPCDFGFMFATHTTLDFLVGMSWFRNIQYVFPKLSARIHRPYLN